MTNSTIVAAITSIIQQKNGNKMKEIYILLQRQENC